MEHLPSFSNHIQSLSAEVAILSDSLGSKVENAWRIHHVRPSMARLYLGRTRFEGTQRAAVCHSVSMDSVDSVESCSVVLVCI